MNGMHGYVVYSHALRAAQNGQPTQGVANYIILLLLFREFIM